MKKIIWIVLFMFLLGGCDSSSNSNESKYIEQKLVIGQELQIGDTDYFVYAGMSSTDIFSIKSHTYHSSINLYYPISVTHIGFDKKWQIDIIEVTPEYIKIGYNGN